MNRVARDTVVRTSKPPVRVLVVEDDPNSRWALTALLKRMGYDCRTAEDGRQAIEAVSAFQPQIILMDLMMPGLDGLAATRQLKGDDATRAIPILAVSADDTPTGRAAALKAGCDDFVPKPIFFEDLIRRLRRQIRP
jgi:CheY-like chemotaxis protein